ncbi:MAG: XrtA system polysaccharide chain length determinant [Pseudomonadota bacterium]
MEELISQLYSFLKGIWKYRWYAIVTAWVIVLIGGARIYTLPDNYQASARVFVDTQGILKPLLSGMTTIPNMEQQVSIMSRTLLSRPNIEKVLRMVDLDIKTRTAKEHEDLVDGLISEIKLLATGRDDLYTISYNNENPKLAKDVVQSLLTIFVEGSFGDKKQDSEKAVQFIDEQIKSYEDKLIAAENALKEFKIKNGGVLSQQGVEFGTRLADTSNQLNQAKLELLEAEQSRNSIKQQIAGEEPTLSSADLSPPAPANPELDGRIQALTKNLDSLRLQFTEQHPDIVSTKRLIAQLEAKKLEEAKVVKYNVDPGVNYSPMLQQLKVALSDAEAKVAAMKVRVAEYAARYSQLRSLSNLAPEVEAQFSQINRDYQLNKSNYEQLVSRRDAAKLSGDLSSNTEIITFRVIDPPTVPLTPAGPNRPRLFSMVFLGSLLAGIGVALMMSQIRPTFLSQHALREATGLPILGTVTMNWTSEEKNKQRRGLFIFGVALIILLSFYGGVMARMLMLNN